MSGDFALSDGGALTFVGVADRWTDLANLVTATKNIIARPGTFSTLFPETSDDALVGLLQDALAECHLEGTLATKEADDNGLVRPVLTSGEGALVVLYAGIRLLRSELLNRITSTKYVAGPVSAEATYATNVLRDIMKALETQKGAITKLLTTTTAASAFSMADSYIANAFGYAPNGVLLADWLPSVYA